MLTSTDKPFPGADYNKTVTIYEDTEAKTRGYILYFHGGGLLYGSRKDLPQLHLDRLTESGFVILSFDYPLAPYSKLDTIMDDVLQSINGYDDLLPEGADPGLPYFLFGRSAGAYLALLAASKGDFAKAPAGVISYYGYGFFTDGWYDASSNYYNSLPAVDESCLMNIPDCKHAAGDLDTHFSVYVYARQTGKWKELIYEGRDKYFYSLYTLRLCDKLPCPLFAAHSSGDTDIPFDEFLELCKRYSPTRFIASVDEHDFDRDTTGPFTVQLLDETVEFLNSSC